MYYMRSIHTRSKRVLIAMCISVLLLSNFPLTRVQAAAGDLDPSFGSGGKVVTNPGGSADAAFSVILQPDGKIIAGGSFNGVDFALARYNFNGSLDSSFGSGGIARADFGTGSESIRDLALQSDGKIVAVGFSNSVGGGPDDFALARFNSNGSLDTSFGAGGKVTTDFFGSFDEIFAVAIQTDGRIVVVGSAFIPNSSVFVTARYNSNGSLDTSFGTGGAVTNSFIGQGQGVAVQPDGKIIASGSAGGGFAIVKYNPNGSLDTSFGLGGKAIFVSNGDLALASAFGVQSDGKLIVAGQSFVPFGQPDFAIVRFNSNGSIDTGFGSGGKVITDFFGFGDRVTDIGFEPDGKIVAGGTALKNNSLDGLDFALARYNVDGSLDSSFGSGGKITTDFFGHRDELQAIAIQPDGRIVAVGLTQTTSEIFSLDFALARYINIEEPAPVVDICLQDDSSGNLLQINSSTGDYQFTNCGGFAASGTGAMIRKGSTITLQHNEADRRVLAKIDTSVNKGSASVQIFSRSATFTITDRNTLNNTCACR